MTEGLNVTVPGTSATEQTCAGPDGKGGWFCVTGCAHFPTSNVNIVATVDNDLHIPPLVSTDGRPPLPYRYYPDNWAEPSPEERLWMQDHAPSFDGRPIYEEVSFVASDGKNVRQQYQNSIQEEMRSFCRRLRVLVEESIVIAGWMHETPILEIRDNRIVMIANGTVLPFYYGGYMGVSCNEHQLVDGYNFMRNEFPKIETEMLALRHRFMASSKRTETTTLDGVVKFSEGDCESSDSASIGTMDAAGLLQKMHGHHVEVTIVDHGPAVKEEA